MAIAEADVRHIGRLARLEIQEERVASLVLELNGILRHMEALRETETRPEQAVEGIGAGGMPLREDGGTPIPLVRGREDFAPEMREGFFIVPRLATHESAPDGDA
jgi:aspartyl-tRNA(Asn)/glutamyl-tRNA(Gln) amidotransferase subunit C